MSSSHSDLIDSGGVFGTHGELVRQSDCVFIKVFATVEGRGIRSDPQHRWDYVCSDVTDQDSRHELGCVVFAPEEEVSLAPLQEVVQSRLRIGLNNNVVFVCPDLQAHQHDSNVERSIQLWGGVMMKQLEQLPQQQPSRNVSSFTLST